MKPEEIQQIKDAIEELLDKMTVRVLALSLEPSLEENAKEAIGARVTVEDPQILIGQNGATLVELQRLLRIMLNKKLKKDFYLQLDINDYKKKKIEHVKDLAMSAADEVVSTKKKKVLPPMSSYERRIVHTELSLRQDVATESQGEGFERCVVVSPK